jgi:hypothetical protein
MVEVQAMLSRDDAARVWARFGYVAARFRALAAVGVNGTVAGLAGSDEFDNVGLAASERLKELRVFCAPG